LSKPALWHMFNRIDWLPIIVQFSKICYQFHASVKRHLTTWL